MVSSGAGVGLAVAEGIETVIAVAVGAVSVAGALQAVNIKAQIRNR